MGRWQPDARGRLLNAAIELFSERGYDETTAAQIADRAGLTKTTLFRHFADKREILFQGQDLLVTLATDSVASAPQGSTPFELLGAGLVALSSFHSADQRDNGRLLEAILTASPELMERAAFKRSTITGALHRALTDRLGDTRQAGVLADAGIRSYYDGFASWIAAPRGGPLVDVVRLELQAYQSVIASLRLSSAP